MFALREQASPTAEDVTEIRINSHRARENNLNMTHVSHEGHTSGHLSRWLSKSRDQVLPRPNVVFHAKTSPGSPWVARTLSLLSSMKRGKVSSNSTTVKLLCFWGDYSPYASVHNSKLVAGAQPTRSLIDTSRGYHLWSSKYHVAHSHSFPSSILHFSLVTPSGLIEDKKSLLLT
jgi:hypothetical protein